MTLIGKLAEHQKKLGFKGEQKTITLQDGRLLKVTCDTWTLAELLGKISEGYYFTGPDEIKVGCNYESHRPKSRFDPPKPKGGYTSASLGGKSIGCVWVIDRDQDLTFYGVKDCLMRDMPTHVTVRVPDWPERRMPEPLIEISKLAFQSGVSYLVFVK